MFSISPVISAVRPRVTPQQAAEAKASPLPLHAQDALTLRFSGAEAAETPQAANLTPYQLDDLLLGKLIPEHFQEPVRSAIRKHKKDWVRLDLSVETPPQLMVLRDKDLVAVPVGTKLFKRKDLLDTHRHLENNLTGPAIKEHRQKLQSVVKLIGLGEAQAAAQKDAIEQGKIQGQELDDLASLFPADLRKSIRNFMEKQQTGKVLKIHVSPGEDLAVRFVDDKTLHPIALPKNRTIIAADVKFVHDQIELNEGVLEVGRPGAKKVAATRDANATLQKMTKLIKLPNGVGETTKPAAVKRVAPSGKPTLEPADFDALVSLFPEAYHAGLQTIPADVRQHLHGITLQLSQPLSYKVGTQTTVLPTRPVTFKDLTSVEESLEDMHERPLREGNSDDPKTWNRIQIRLKSIMAFKRTLVSSGAPAGRVYTPDPALIKRNEADFQRLVEILPPDIREKIQALETKNPGKVEEIVLSAVGRPLKVIMNNQILKFSDLPVTQNHITLLNAAFPDFGPKDRAGIPGTLHRIAPIRGQGADKVSGYSIRVARAVDVNIGALIPGLSAGESLLVLGEPGVGKTTLLRKITRFMDSLTQINGRPMNGNVVVVDTSSEIGGYGDVPHPFLGDAIRLQVPFEAQQYQIMRRAVQNHRAKVVVIDEIGTRDEAEAACVIARNGGMLVGTAHGNDFSKLIDNPELAHLVGRPKEKTIGDQLMKLEGKDSKTIIEMTAEPPFQTLLVMKDRNTGEYYPDFTAAIKAELKGKGYKPMLIDFPARDVAGTED